jgi:hypothetical protein
MNKVFAVSDGRVFYAVCTSSMVSAVGQFRKAAIPGLFPTAFSIKNHGYVWSIDQHSAAQMISQSPDVIFKQLRQGELARRPGGAEEDWAVYVPPLDWSRTSPRPWSRNPEWPGESHGTEPSPILNAHGGEVMTPTEWLTIADEDLTLIIRAVNAYKE